MHKVLDWRKFHNHSRCKCCEEERLSLCLCTFSVCCMCLLDGSSNLSTFTYLESTAKRYINVFTLKDIWIVWQTPITVNYPKCKLSGLYFERCLWNNQHNYSVVCVWCAKITMKAHSGCIAVLLPCIGLLNYMVLWHINQHFSKWIWTPSEIYLVMFKYHVRVK